MKTYTEIETGVIQWREVNGESATIGLIREGEERTRTNEEGETETYSPWGELLDSGAEIQWRTDEEKAAEIAEHEAAQKKVEDAKAKMIGVEFEGVMCSLTADDQWGLGSMLPLIQMGHSFNFSFKNGNRLHIGPENIEAFMFTWVTAREEFFKTAK